MSTTKLRIVFDASSNSPSLNDCLEKGPCLLPMLIDILIRFGTYKIAVASDIEKAFLNIAVNKNDRDFLRFLWFHNVNNSNPKVISYRYSRVLFGMNSSQFLLLVSIMKHLYQYKHCDPEFVNNFLINLYVDDSIAGGDTSNEGPSIKYVRMYGGRGGYPETYECVQGGEGVNDSEYVRGLTISPKLLYKNIEFHVF
ncbi:uncharacterized protein LOC136082904 [Hydra vulgaris]|uniref:uncharacterized protein LOC136082904 n=1 Tax=Hydra vulgaris TaxID=6087 RepID=UPI0032EA47E8